jgi:hypothetical protein
VLSGVPGGARGGQLPGAGTRRRRLALRLPRARTVGKLQPVSKSSADCECAGLGTYESNVRWCAGGLVGVSSFAVLPDVGPGAALSLVLAALAPCLIRLWRAPSPSGFVHAVSYAAMCRRAWLRAESACRPSIL